MRHLIIKNVGPIKDVDIQLRRFNVLIGPQSSGKSTIAKILSTCSWVEKEVATTQNPKTIPNASAFRSLVENFHKMAGYFRTDSEVSYETDAIRIHYAADKFEVSLKETAVYRRKKVCYIPSERHVVTLPELQGYEFKATNLRSFLFDWMDARAFYDPQNKTENILNLGVKYYFDENNALEKDRIEHINGVTYGISLPNASSGLQSVVPLYVMLKYYSGQYYSDYGQKVSFAGKERENKLFLMLVDRYILSRMPQEDGNAVQIFQKCVKAAEDGNEEYRSWLSELNVAVKYLTIPHSTDFIVEEPEQNLFPTTQKELVDYMVSVCGSSEHKHGFTVTTHSPYVLSALNNLIYAYQVGQKNADKVRSVVPENCWLAPSDVCAWMLLPDGILKDIIDSDLNHIMAEQIDSASTLMNEVFYSLMNIDSDGEEK